MNREEIIQTLHEDMMIFGISEYDSDILYQAFQNICKKSPCGYDVKLMLKFLRIKSLYGTMFQDTNLSKEYNKLLTGENYEYQCNMAERLEELGM